MSRSAEPQNASGSKIAELLEADRELSPDEMQELAGISAIGWDQVVRRAEQLSARVYAVATPDEFFQCCKEHMNGADRSDMVRADLYTCRCGRVLKDRRTPVSAAVLGERERIRNLWLQVEEAEGTEDFSAAVDLFRRAIGLPGTR